MKKHIVVITPFLILIFLMSCNSLVEKTPKITSTPLSIPFATTTKTPTSTSSLTPSPTIATSPTSTPSPTLDSHSATSEAYLATNWAPVYATLESRSVKCEEGYELELPDEVDRMSNEQWSIFTCSPKPEDVKTMWTPGVVDYSTRYTELLKTDFSQSWVISYKDFSWSTRPYQYLSVRQWTQDGNFVYLIPAYYPDDSTSPFGFRYSSVLYRMNLYSGDFEVVLPHKSQGYSFSLSPDDQHLAYSLPDEKNVVHIRDMTNGAEQQITLSDEYVLTGAFAWSLDSTKLFFASAINGWVEGKAGVSIFKLTIKNLYLQPILQNDIRLLVPFAHWENGNLIYWMDENLLYVRSLDYPSVEYYSEMALDIQSGSVIILATPEPFLIGSATPKP